jgi:hypothetical protein
MMQKYLLIAAANLNAQKMNHTSTKSPACRLQSKFLSSSSTPQTISHTYMPL